MKYIAWVASSATLLLFVTCATAQPLENGARVSGTGGAGTATSGLLALRLNPASVCCSSSFFLMMGYSRAFGLAELDHYHAAVGKKIGHSQLALAIESFGFDVFRHHGLHVVGARLIEALGLSVGGAVSAERVSIPGAKKAQVVNNGIGVIIRLGNHLNVGASIRRLFQIGDYLEEGRLLIVGASLRPTHQLAIVVDALKDARFPVSVRGGIEILPVPVLALRGGMSVAPEALSLGVGIDTGIARLDLAANRHATLGWSRAISMSIEV